ncbi:ferritin-like domain-containing protein [Thermococcus sp.]
MEMGRIMLDVDDVIERLSRVSYEEAVAYWIESEREEAEFYRKLAERARNLGLGESIVETFERLSRESLEHAQDLLGVFRKEFGKEPRSDLPPLEVLPVLDKLERADQIGEVLRAAIESELMAVRAYEKLADKVMDEKLKELYLKLAEVERDHYEALKREYEKLGGGDD